MTRFYHTNTEAPASNVDAVLEKQASSTHVPDNLGNTHLVVVPAASTNFETHHYWASSEQPHNDLDWPTTGYGVSLDVSLAGADLTYGFQMRRIPTTADAIYGNLAALTGQSGTGIKTSTGVAWSNFNVNSNDFRSASDQLSVRITASNASMMNDANLGLYISDSSSWIEGVDFVAPSSVPNGSASGSFSFTGSASGEASHEGSANGTLSFTGSADGATDHSGDANGTFAWTGAADGTAPSSLRSGSAVGTFTFLGNANGEALHNGSAAGSFAWGGTASGTTPHEGSATGSFIFTGSADGTAPGVAGSSGSASGAFTFAGTANGQTAHGGSAEGTFTFTGEAIGASSFESLMPNGNFASEPTTLIDSIAPVVGKWSARSGSFTWDDTDYVSAGHSLRYDGGDFIASDSVPVETGRTYTAVLQIKADVVLGTEEIGATYKRANNTFAGSSADQPISLTPGVWTEVTVSFTVPTTSGLAYMILLLDGNANTSIRFDDIVVRVVPAGEATGTFPTFDGEATGEALHEGSAEGTFVVFSGEVTGRAQHEGVSPGAYTWVGEASGQGTTRAEGAFTWTGSASGEAATIYMFSPPTHEEPMRTDIKPLSFYRLTYSTTVFRRNGSFTAMRTPPHEWLTGERGVDYFIGGHEYRITEEIATELTGAGFSVTTN